jgi:hypothetical protein
MWEKIKLRSSSPLWINFLLCFLSNDTELNLYSNALRKSIIELGIVAKILDDIVDLTDDYLNNKWNYVLIKAREKNPFIFDEIKNSDIKIIKKILDDNIVHESIDEAIMYYHSAINRLHENKMANSEFENYIKMFYSNWFKSFKNEAQIEQIKEY